MRLLKDGAAWLAVLLTCASVVFGGASRDNAFGAGVISFIACPLLGICLWRLFSTPAWRRHRVTLALIGACWAVLLIQLVPIPLSLYAAAPGRAQTLVALDLAGVRPAFLPLSMNPEATWGAVIGAISPTAMLLATVCLARSARLTAWYVGLAGAGIVLGMAQRVLGDRFHPYSWTWSGAFSGFFANHNHFATLLLALLPICAVFATARLPHGRGASVLRWVTPGLMCLVVLFALVAIGSRFGVLMAIPIGALTLLIGVGLDGYRGFQGAIVAGTVVAGLAACVVAPLAMPNIVDRFIEKQPGPSRLEAWSRSLAVADIYLPLGAGAGAFDRVYRAQEDPLQVEPTYLNEVHNDYLQLLLEGGWAALLLTGIVVAAIVVASVSTWRRSDSVQSRLSKAATIGLFVIAAHSVVDYPLRTPAIAVLAAFLLGQVLARADDNRENALARNTALPSRQ
jgi:hypothetical protein